MRKQDFYGLPRSIQDRFIESSQAVAAPAPLAVLPVGDKSALLWGAATLVCAGAWAAFTSMGIGELNSSFALTTLPHKIAHMVFAGLVAACALRAYALSWAVRRLPYGSGNYLFPSGVVSARGSALTVHDSQEFKSARASGSQVRVEFADGSSFQFPTESKEKAEQAVKAFEEGAAKWKDLQGGEALELARLNPLMESGVANPLAPTQPHAQPVLLGPVLFGAVVAILALILGFGVASWRDSISRDALYTAAREKDTVEAYRAYLERGGTKEEVSTLLLPRAELKGAIAKGSIEALVEFKDKNPDTQIKGEIQNALRAALLKELEKAKKKGTVTAIAEVPKKFKDHKLIEGEIAAARRAVFAKALADFQETASEEDPNLVAFVQALITHAETKGPTVELRFVHDFPQDPKMLDQIVSKSKKYYMGRKSLPTQYFLGDAARRREKAVLEKIQARLQKAFPKDILEFKLGAVPKKANEEPPAIKVPTLTFSHRERLSGGFVGGKPKAMYMGVALLMSAKGEIPNSDQVIDFRWNAWRSPQFSILADKEKDIPDVDEDMMGGSFDKFTDIYLGRWFKEP